MKGFADSERHAFFDLIYVVFIGPGHKEGGGCYFHSKIVTAHSKPFEIWSNCRTLFQPGNFFLKDKPKIFLINLATGDILVHIVKSYQTYFNIKHVKVYKMIKFTLETSSECTGNETATAGSLSEKLEPEPIPSSLEDFMVLYASCKGKFYKGLFCDMSLKLPSLF